MRTEIKPKDLRNITGLKDWEKETNILFNADAEQAKATERELSAFYALGKQLLNARQNKRAIAPLFAELQKLVDTYENY